MAINNIKVYIGSKILLYFGYELVGSIFKSGSWLGGQHTSEVLFARFINQRMRKCNCNEPWGAKAS